MRERTLRWLVLLVLSMLLAIGTFAGTTAPQVVHGAEYTPTPTLPQPDDPGGHGGGGY